MTHSWLFPEKPNNVFHMVASEDCNGAMKRKIRKGRLHPIATFTKTGPWILVTESNVIEENTSGSPESIENCTDNLLKTSENSSSIPLLEPTVSSHNVTVTDENDKTSTVLVVFGVIVTFLTVQVGIYCNCSC